MPSVAGYLVKEMYICVADRGDSVECCEEMDRRESQVCCCGDKVEC